MPFPFLPLLLISWVPPQNTTLEIMTADKSGWQAVANIEFPGRVFKCEKDESNPDHESKHIGPGDRFCYLKAGAADAFDFITKPGTVGARSCVCVRMRKMAAAPGAVVSGRWGLS